MSVSQRARIGLEGMVNDYDWRDLRNVVGWVASVVRLATERASVGVHLVEKQLRVAEAFASGKGIVFDHDTFMNLRTPIYSRSYDRTGDAHHAVDNLLSTVRLASDQHSSRSMVYGTAGLALTYAAQAGVSQDEVVVAYWRWIIRDLAGNRRVDRRKQRAAAAALSIGNTALAREIIRRGAP